MSAVTQEIDRRSTGTSASAFTRLLHWLDEGVDSQGERYLDMRRRLVDYFDRRSRPAPDVLADETFDRIARTLDETGYIKVTPPARYCYVVARFVLLEDIRASRRSVPFDEARLTSRSIPVLETAEDGAAQRSLDCLDRCLGRLKAEERSLIVEYYRDAKRERIDRRRSIAQRLGITMNALGIRAWRVRASLESCVGACRKRS